MKCAQEFALPSHVHSGISKIQSLEMLSDSMLTSVLLVVCSLLVAQYPNTRTCISESDLLRQLYLLIQFLATCGLRV